MALGALAVAEEAFANVRADEARAAGDEKIHGEKLNGRGEGVERAGTHRQTEYFLKLAARRICFIQI
jgi:hypothetical protein